MFKNLFCPLLCGSNIKDISLHLIFCQKKHLLGKYYFQCPYNANHIFGKKAYEYHIKNCPDEFKIKRKKKREKILKNKKRRIKMKSNSLNNIEYYYKNDNESEITQEEENENSLDKISIKIIEAVEENEGMKNLEENILKLELEIEDFDDLKSYFKFKKIKESNKEIKLRELRKKKQEENIENEKLKDEDKEIEILKEDDDYFNDILIKKENNNFFSLNCELLDNNKNEDEILTDRTQKDYSLSTKSDNSDTSEDKIRNIKTKRKVSFGKMIKVILYKQNENENELNNEINDKNEFENETYLKFM